MAVTWTSDLVRSTFIEFFEKKKDHTFVRSSPVLPHDDPTLLFTNAGMNQFKPIFLGTVDPKSPMANMKRAVNSQKCIRAGGKHNDLDDVGKDVYHHTFFEMLGNWSFGDYFKREAIDWAWELLTDVYKLDPNRIYVTYFEGNAAQGVPEDTEARDIWLEKLPKERVLPFGMKENFWEMGDQGPCGPCSEIHFDKIGGRDAASLVNRDDPMVIEIWNNVFIQFNREADGKLVSLPAKHVDTGMGLERLTAILQNVPSNYDIDLFSALFSAIKTAIASDVHPYTGKVGKEDEGGIDMAYRVVADHIRTLTIAITDGVIPSADGRGYVLRRILRRAVRYGRSVLGAKATFFCKLVPELVRIMSGAFPELAKDPESVQKILQEEEEQFAKTLASGEQRFRKLVANIPKGGEVPAREVFELYSTYGFPFDLTQILADETGVVVNQTAVQENLKTFQQQSRDGGAKKGDEVKFTLDANAIAAVQKQFPATVDLHKFESDAIEGVVKAIWTETGYVDATDEKTTLAGIIFDKTNFYAESGGQIHDTGSIVGKDGVRHEVTDVQVFGGYVLHTVRLNGAGIKNGDVFTLEVNHVRRAPIKSNHTSTHLVNFALRKVLGHGVHQKGSLVLPERFRFDFSHNKPVSNDELGNIDNIVNEIITKNLPVHTKDVPLEQAMKITGLRAVFGEQYPDPVRLVSIGKTIEELFADPTNTEWESFSIEFCGGTHLKVTSEASSFTVVSEEPLAKGIRRITAVTGVHANEAVTNAKQLLSELESLEKLKSDDELSAGLVTLLNKLSQPDLLLPATQKHNIRKAIDKRRNDIHEKSKGKIGDLQKVVSSFVESTVKSLTETPVPFLVGVLEVGGSGNLVTDAIKSIQEKHPSVAVLLASPDSAKKKLLVISSCPKGVIEKGLKANEWATEAAKAAGGKGGGKPETAQGAGTDVSKLPEALEAARNWAKAKLG